MVIVFVFSRSTVEANQIGHQVTKLSATLCYLDFDFDILLVICTTESWEHGVSVWREGGGVTRGPSSFFPQSPPAGSSGPDIV